MNVIVDMDELDVTLADKLKVPGTMKWVSWLRSKLRHDYIEKWPLCESKVNYTA